MKPPTDNQIMEDVYKNTFNETSREIEMYINGMKAMRDKWLLSTNPAMEYDKGQSFIYERDGNSIYRRPFGSLEPRELIKITTDEGINNRD